MSGNNGTEITGSQGNTGCLGCYGKGCGKEKIEVIPICNQDGLYVLYYQLFGNAFLICENLRNQRLIFFVFESYQMQEERRFSAADLTDLR
ncbi:MAG: hypothetical protein R6X11_10255 [Desulfonatronovibrio sp.]